MTKMPDKIYVTKNMTAFAHNADPEAGEYELTSYTRSDLIPQPVTDEARAKALEWVEAAADFIPEHFSGHYDTIKAALSQPDNGIAATTYDRGLEVGESEKTPPQNTGEGAFASAPVDPVSGVQPEAIQKAVEALERFAKVLDMQTERYVKRGGNPDIYPDTHPSFDVDSRQLTIGQWRKIKVALEGLRTHQSELEALKAENADLRRAVVDLVEAVVRSVAITKVKESSK